MTTVPTIDFDTEFEGIVQQLKDEAEQRLAPPVVRLWDGDWNLRGVCKREFSCSVQWLNNETGTASIDMPLDYYLSEWLVDVDARPTTNVHLTVDKDGARWSGLMEELQIHKDDKGVRYVRVIFKHDYEHLKHILVWSNPFLPAEIQFPRLWVCFSNHVRWALKTTLLCNLMRLESSLWMLPDDPMDPAQWFNFDQSTWGMVVKPDLTPDRSVGGIVYGRFKTMHEASRRITEDAQLTWEPRRYLDGDPPPWPGANIKHGCLVWDLVDNSAFNTGTSFGGSLFDGLAREFVNIGSDGLTETVETVPDPNVPDLYLTPGERGTDPSMPGVIWRDGEYTGIQTSMFSYRPAQDVGVVGGGHSMPGVNEGISAAIIGITGFLGSLIGQSQIGPAIDAVLKPLYTDVLLAFGKWKSPARAQRLGWSHYHERWADGSDRAYTLSWLLAMRAAMWATREQTRCTISVVDGSPWRIGQNGLGHCFLGSRVGFTVLGMKPGRIFVEQITELKLAWDRASAPAWTLQIGQREPEDPVMKAFQLLQDFFGMLQDLGVL
ncbi:phage tail protein [Rhodococcus pyridinivorans]|uniref:Gp37-like protein n=1 Tax=Rhodococcus pyridinivorans TaxID=103816 RepID=UPI003AAF01FD